VSSIRPHPRLIKTAIRRSDLSGSFVVGKYSFSPYMACEHGCIYCDGRAERYWVEGEFDRDIVVRSNIPERLATELPGLREKGFITIGSGISDAYQPIEQRERIMERCAALLADHDHPVALMTKSSLVLRDIRHWKRVNDGSRFMLLVSLTHADDETRRSWEPGASSVTERLDVLRRFKDAGCATGVLAMPLLPGITDTDDNLHRLYEAVVAAGVDFVMPGGLTLRPGRQKDVALLHLRQVRPDLMDDYTRIYREERKSGSPAADYVQPLNRRLTDLNVEYGIPALVPHRIFRGQLHIYDEVNVLLHHMVELYGARGVPTRRLSKALERYLAWLAERKRAYNLHRSWSYEDLDGELRGLCDGTGLAEMLENGKLADFVCRIVVDRCTLNYASLDLDAPS